MSHFKVVIARYQCGEHDKGDSGQVVSTVKYLPG